MVRVDHAVSHPLDRLQDRLRAAIRPGPGIAEPQGRQHVQQSGFRPAIVDADPDQHVLRGGLGILDDDVEVAVAVEDAGVDELVLELVPRPLAIRRHEVVVGIGRLGVLVEILHVRVSRRAVEVEVILFDVLAMVALAIGQPEQPLLENRVRAVPERQRETQDLVAVTDPRQPILAPAVGAGAGLIMGEIVPGVAVVAVVLPHRPPLPLAEIGAPEFPGARPLPGRL